MIGINIDLSELKGLSEGIEAALKSASEEAAKNLSAMLYAKAVELANERLHTRRKKFIEALSQSEEGGIYILSLDESVNWIDDGMEPHSMVENLLKSPKAKRAKDGSSYLVVPFEHGPGKGPAQNSPEQQGLVDAIKSEMKRQKIPFSKVERDKSGKPKMGLLHKFNVKTPNKTSDGPGQGWGPTGQPRQGPNANQKLSQKKKTPGGGGTPHLHGVSVYQTPDGKGGAKRSIMTFRIVSSKHGGDRWKHPGLEGVNIMADTFDWANEEIDKMTPQLLDMLMSKL